MRGNSHIPGRRPHDFASASRIVDLLTELTDVGALEWVVVPSDSRPESATTRVGNILYELRHFVDPYGTRFIHVFVHTNGMYVWAPLRFFRRSFNPYQQRAEYPAAVGELWEKVKRLSG